MSNLGDEPWGLLSNCQLPLKFLPWGPSPGNGLYGGGWVHLIVLPSSLPPQGKQPAVGSAQLPLESGHVFFQLLSSLDPLENSASLSLEGCTGLGGGRGRTRELPGAFRATNPPCFRGKFGLRACSSVAPLCVRPGSGTQLLGL